MVAHDQWIRKVSLFVLTSTDPNAATDAGKDLSQFRIRFKTYQADPTASRPPYAIIRVTNLAPATEKQFMKEYNSVVLQAGYENGKFGIIFQGQIKAFRRGHETPTDSILEIWAADSDIPYSHSVMNQTLAAGWTNKELINAAVDQLVADGAKKGYSADGISDAARAALGTNIRGTTQWGMTHQHLTGATSRAGSTWTFDNGKLNIIPLEGYLPSKEAIKLSAGTGMVWWPAQEQDGIYVECLLNPAIRVGNIVQIDNKDINQTRAPGGGFGIPPDLPILFPGEKDINIYQPIDADGWYRVLLVEHVGDSRGGDWYTSLTCLQADMSAQGAAQGQGGVADQQTPVPPPAGENLPTSDPPDPPVTTELPGGGASAPLPSASTPLPPPQPPLAPIPGSRYRF
jgi:hypothetical protein